MIAPLFNGRPALLTRSLIAAATAGIGIAIGWSLTRGSLPVAKWFLPVITLTSTALFAVELIRAKSRSALWAVCLCGLLAGRAVYELAMLVLER